MSNSKTHAQKMSTLTGNIVRRYMYDTKYDQLQSVKSAYKAFTDEEIAKMEINDKAHIVSMLIHHDLLDALDILTFDFFVSFFSTRWAWVAATRLSSNHDAIKHIPRQAFACLPITYWRTVLDIDPTLSEFFDIARVGRQRAYQLLMLHPHLYARYDSLLKTKLTYKMWCRLLEKTDIEKYLHKDYRQELLMLKLRS